LKNCLKPVTLYRVRFVSTQNKTASVSFGEAILHCLPDAGLFVPETFPDIRRFFPCMDENTAYRELAAALIPLLFEHELNSEAAAGIAGSAFDVEPSLIRLNKTFSVLNLYEGPAGTHTDFSTGFLAAVLEELLAAKDPPGRAMVVSAVRCGMGSMGASIAGAFRRRRGITTVLLYPENAPIAGLDEEDYVTRGGGLIPIRVKGTADDCQELVNALIRDRPFAGRYNVTSANAINAGRLLPQAFYYLYSFIRLKKELSGELFFSVPSGNLGSLVAGLYAWKLGMPVNGFIAAMNSNNAAGSFINEGVFRPRPLVVTNSPVLDIARPSNLERLEAFYRESPLVMKNLVFPRTIGDADTLQTMKEARENHGMFLAPQSAVACAAAEDMARSKDFYGHIVIFATSHPARYAKTVFKATGETPETPEKIKALSGKPEPIAAIENDLESLESAIASCV
jgi:threonine synthase